MITTKLRFNIGNGYLSEDKIAELYDLILPKIKGNHCKITLCDIEIAFPEGFTQFRVRQLINKIMKIINQA